MEDLMPKFENVYDELKGELEVLDMKAEDGFIEEKKKKGTKF